MDDARALLKASRWRGAMYMAGYTVECLLKTKLMKIYDCHHLNELEARLRERRVLSTRGTVFTHQLEILLRLTQSLDRLRQDQPTWRLFNIVNRWIPAWRYSADPSRREDAEDFLEAVAKVARWIERNV
jgi:HEPN domain-containing protein